MIKAVLFDLDGTLVDSNALHVRAWAEVLREHGVAVTDEEIHAQIGKGADLLVPALDAGADKRTAKRLGDAHGALFKDKYRALVTPFPGARALLAHTRSTGRRVVLASSASTDDLDHYLDLLDARALVDASTTSDDVDRSKPEADVFVLALEKVGISPDEALVVGDSPYDVEGARKCGLGAVALRSGGFSDETLHRAGAAALYDDAAALLAGFASSPLSA